MLRLLGRIGFWLLVIVFIIYTVVPFYWAVNTSFKSNSEIVTTPITYLPGNFTVENYETAFRSSEFIGSIVNSFIVAGLGTILALVIGGGAAYAMGRFRFYGRTTMRYVILSMNLFPTIAVLPSLLDIVTDLGLTGNILSLLITYPLFTIPLTTWNLIVFFQGLPPDIEQAAYVDGATPFQLFTRILIPLTIPVLLTTGLIVFVSFWSEYLLALTFTAANPDSYTVTVAISLLRDQFTDGGLMAAAVILSVPLILIIFYTQRRFITNTTEGAVKG